MIVRGPELSLRYPTEDDAPALLELGRDPDVTRFFSWGPYERLAEPLAYIRALAEMRAAGTRLEFVIADRHDRPVGITGLSEFATRDRRAVVGTWLGRRHWGSGANGESKALVLALGFRELGLLRATAYAHPANARSLAALERLGFRREGLLRAWHLHGESSEDCAILGLLREEWERGPLARVPATFEGALPPAFSRQG